jgi:hypothetical protein
MVVIIKVTVFWTVTPCSLVDMYGCFRGTCCLHLQGRGDTSGSSEVLVPMYQTTQSQIPENCNLKETDCEGHPESKDRLVIKKNK